MIGAAYTWGIGGPDFLWLYAGLSVALAVAVGLAWRVALRSGAGADGERELSMYELAMINGGPHLAVTTAATQLLRAGVLRRDGGGALTASGAPATGSHALERAVFDTVRRAQPAKARRLHGELAQSDALESLRTELVGEGLLLEESRARRLRWAWLLGAGLVVLGAARVVADLLAHRPVANLVAVSAVVAVATAWLARKRPNATARGRRVLERRQEQRADLKRVPQAAHSALTVALFGVSALWLADPEIAAALGAPREGLSGATGSHASAGGGCGGGGCGGCGGCG